MSDKKYIRCTGCHKPIAEGSIQEGQIAIECRCGVRNEIRAEVISRPETIATRCGNYSTRLNERIEKK